MCCACTFCIISVCRDSHSCSHGLIPLYYGSVVHGVIFTFLCVLGIDNKYYVSCYTITVVLYFCTLAHWG